MMNYLTCRNFVIIQRSNMGAYIYTIGCIDAVNSWVNLNMIPVAAGAVGVAVVEVSLDLNDFIS